MLLLTFAGSMAEPTGFPQLLGELVPRNPLAFFSGTDLACRSQKVDILHTILAGGLHLPHFKNQPLLVTSSHVKAFISAMASWVKAYINRLPGAGDLSAAPGGIECPSDALAKAAAVKSMISRLKIVLSDSVGCQGGGPGDGMPGQVGGEVTGWTPVHSSIQLVLLLWLSRAVWATCRLLLLVINGPSSTTGSTNNTSGSSSNGSGEVMSRAAAVKTLASPSSSSDGGVTQFSSSIAEHGNAGKANVICTSSGISSTSGAQTPITVTSSSRSMKTAHSPGDSSSRSSCVDGTSVEHTTEPHIRLLLVEGYTLAMKLHESLLQWHVRASPEGPQPAPASAASSNATTPGPAVAPGVAADGEAGLTYDGEAAAPAAAAATGVSLCEQLPQRFSRLPRHGLPEGVVELLRRSSSRWAAVDLREEMMTEDRQVQQQIFREMVELYELLQREVPCPVGCNNPHCGNLKGVSEIAASCKTCTGCGVARYCSRECQVGHWKEHRIACRRLQKGLNG